MNKIAIKSLFLLAFIAGGCSTLKTPAAMGGSKADGSVTMGFSVAMFEEPVVDWESARAEATAKCKAWGYSDAKAFGGQKTTCNEHNGYGNCVERFVSMDYQCLGGKAVQN